MKIQILFTTAILSGGLLIGCAHHRDVRPGADGIHRVVVRSDDNDEASRDAIDQANSYCDQQKKSAAFVNENKKYTGDMDEQSYKNAKRVSSVAKTVGGITHVLGGKNESAVGGVVGLGGIAADSALGKAYTVEMQFKCQ